MFAMYTDILGQKQVSNEVSGTRLIPLSVKSNDGKTMWVYLVNKNQDSESSAVNLSLTDFKIKNVAITGFDSDGKIINKQDINTSQPDVSHFKLNVPRNSLIKLTFNAL
jgi:hypothetical protein